LFLPLIIHYELSELFRCRSPERGTVPAILKRPLNLNIS